MSLKFSTQDPASPVEAIEAALPDSLYLAADKREGLGHWFTEVILFGKTTRFKNNPRVNAVPLRSLWTVMCIFIVAPTLLFIVSGVVAFLLQSHFTVSFSAASPDQWFRTFFSPAVIIKGSVAFVGAVTVHYWNTTHVFRGQWTYCASLYNEVLKADEPKRSEMLIALAIDLIVVDLWAHRSFRDLFKCEVAEALFHEFDSPSKLQTVIQKICDREFTEDEARSLLERHQRRVLKGLAGSPSKHAHSNGRRRVVS